jgi:hypothetical protein
LIELLDVSDNVFGPGFHFFDRGHLGPNARTEQQEDDDDEMKRICGLVIPGGKHSDLDPSHISICEKLIEGIWAVRDGKLDERWQRVLLTQIPVQTKVLNPDTHHLMGPSISTDSDSAQIQIELKFEDGLRGLSDGADIWKEWGDDNPAKRKLQGVFRRIHGIGDGSVLSRDAASKEHGKKLEKAERETHKRREDDRMKYLRQFCKDPRIADYYNKYVGKSGRDKRASMADVKRDEYKNPVGSDFDLGKDKGFTGFSVLVGQFFHSATESELSTAELRRTTKSDLQDKGFTLDFVDTEEDFICKLDDERTPYVAAWVISHCAEEVNRRNRGRHGATLYDRFAEACLRFHLRGGGLLLFAENEPHFTHCNVVLQRLFGHDVQVGGNEPGDNFVKSPGIESAGSESKGEFKELGHLLTTGVETLYEGKTIAHPGRQDGKNWRGDVTEWRRRGWRPIATGGATISRHNYCALARDARTLTRHWFLWQGIVWGLPKVRCPSCLRGKTQIAAERKRSAWRSRNRR